MALAVVKLGACLISWKSKKQPTISSRSTEAEYRSTTAAVVEVTWITGLLRELKFPVSTPIPLYWDNKVAIQIASNLIYHECTKHIEIN